MGALPKRRISSYRKGKRRAAIKQAIKDKVKSLKSFSQHALKQQNQ